ncbi:hypothetical protein GYM54_14200 [Pseudomonas sp. MTM4]|nr:hypothetical protein [Stutzerimonas stutzeri]MBC8648673.1 hypothetical protein [Pseudomonas sp. MT4]QXY92656.1 hypothetical protein GYM54_14200 [Pseudomonas sp. MTM4]
MTQIAQTPAPPYYAVIFTSLRAEGDQVRRDGGRMLELAALQPGFLGVESARDGVGITVSYWANLKAIDPLSLWLSRSARPRRAYC